MAINVRNKGNAEERRLVRFINGEPGKPAFPGVSAKRTGFIAGERDVAITVHGRCWRLESKRAEGWFTRERSWLARLRPVRCHVSMYEDSKILVMYASTFWWMLGRQRTRDLPVDVPTYSVPWSTPKMVPSKMENASIMWHRNNGESMDDALVFVRDLATCEAIGGAIRWQQILL